MGIKKNFRILSLLIFLFNILWVSIAVGVYTNNPDSEAVFFLRDPSIKNFFTDLLFSVSSLFLTGTTWIALKDIDE